MEINKGALIAMGRKIEMNLYTLLGKLILGALVEPSIEKSFVSFKEVIKVEECIRGSKLHFWL